MLSTRFSSQHLVLGLLVERNGYGYELQQRIEQRFGYLGLSETLVYRVLDKLEADGLIEQIGQKAHGQTRRGAPRLVYSVTDAGHSERKRWMNQPLTRAHVRDELYVKLALSEPADVEALIEATYGLEREYVAELRTLTRPQLRDTADDPMPWKQLAAVLVDEASANQLQSAIESLQRVRAVLRRRAAAKNAV